MLPGEKGNFWLKFCLPECKGCDVQEQCGFTIECGEPCGYIASPWYPELPRQHGMNCHWWIEASQDQVVQLEFIDFDVISMTESEACLLYTSDAADE